MRRWHIILFKHTQVHACTSIQPASRTNEVVQPTTAHWCVPVLLACADVPCITGCTKQQRASLALSTAHLALGFACFLHTGAYIPHLGQDCAGNDILKQCDINTPADCATLCSQDSNCHAFAYAHSGSYAKCCFKKTTTGPLTSNNDVDCYSQNPAQTPLGRCCHTCGGASPSSSIHRCMLVRQYQAAVGMDGGGPCPLLPSDVC